MVTVGGEFASVPVTESVAVFPPESVITTAIVFVPKESWPK